MGGILNGKRLIGGALNSKPLSAIYVGENNVFVSAVPNNEIWYEAPEKITLYTETGVVSHTFENGKGILTFANNITTVQQWFRGCATVTRVYLPRSVTTINEYAFYGCSELGGDIDLPNVTSMGRANFNSCKITSFSAPLLESLPNIGAYSSGVCARCTLLVRISLPSLKTIGGIADGSTGHFQGCTALEDLGDTSNWESIGSGAFNGCTAIKGDLVFPKLTAITNSTINSCKITSFSAPLLESLPNIGAYSSGVCARCTLLVRISLPSLKTIGVTGSNASGHFQNCTALATIYFGSTIPTLGSRAFSGSLGANLQAIYVPADMVDAYKADASWSAYADKIFAYPN